MKLFGNIKETNHAGYQSKMYFFGLPIITKIRDNASRRIYLLGIKVYHKKFKQSLSDNNQVAVDNTVIYIAEILTKAMEKKLKKMRLLELEIKQHLKKISDKKGTR